MKIKQALSLAAIALISLTLAGCNPEYTAPDPSNPVLNDVELSYVSQARDSLGDAIAGDSDFELVSRARMVCNELEQEFTPQQIIMKIMDDGYNTEVAEELILGGTIRLCPQFTHIVK